MRSLRPLPLIACALLVPSVAQAQSPEERAVAETLFQQGRELVESGHFADACPKLAESQRLDPAIGTMLWLADCYASNGQTASAWAGFVDAAAAAARKHDARESIARAKAASLEQKLAKIVVVVPPVASASGLSLQRDGVGLGSAQWGLAIPLDPGIHTISAQAPGRKSWSVTVNLAAEPATLQVTVPVLEVDAPVAAPLPLPGSAAPTAGAGESSPTPSHYWNTRRWIGVTAAGAGAIGLIVGGVFSLQAKSSYDASNSGSCNASNICSQPGMNDRSHAESLATVATVAMGVGAAALAAGAITFFTATGHPAKLTPVAGASPHGATLGLGGVF
jgi:hypothetical protein